MTAPRLAYAAFMLLALAVFLIARHWVPRPAGLARLPRWKRTALGLAAFVGGSLGAKLPFALADPAGWLDGSAWFSDGKTVVAGLIGAYLAVELAKWALEVRVKTGDTFALPLALALAVGRFGCFFNGCCYGVETTLPWGVHFRLHERALPLAATSLAGLLGSPLGQGPLLTACAFYPGRSDAPRVRCHPTQLYESLFHSALAVVLLLLMRRDALPRQRLKLYLIAYAGYRFLTEFIRPEPVWWLGLTFYQWASLALAVGLCVQWVFDRRAAPGA